MDKKKRNNIFTPKNLAIGAAGLGLLGAGALGSKRLIRPKNRNIFKNYRQLKKEADDYIINNYTTVDYEGDSLSRRSRERRMQRNLYSGGDMATEATAYLENKYKRRTRKRQNRNRSRNQFNLDTNKYNYQKNYKV